MSESGGSLVRCPGGHLYDASQNRSGCPYCSIPGLDIPPTRPFAEAPTAPVYMPQAPVAAPGPGPNMVPCGNGHFYDPAKDSTCPHCVRINVNMPATAPPQGLNPNMGSTVREGMRRLGFEPAVGWLVVLEGKERGKDYRLVQGYNRIGRSTASDVSIPSDSSISSERHAELCFDPDSNLYTLVRGQGKGVMYLNGRAVHEHAELVAYDLIKVGATTLLFLPLCGERFQWTKDNPVESSLWKTERMDVDTNPPRP